jgi:hypothetical protein
VRRATCDAGTAQSTTSTQHASEPQPIAFHDAAGDAVVCLALMLPCASCDAGTARSTTTASWGSSAAATPAALASSAAMTATAPASRPPTPTSTRQTSPVPAGALSAECRGVVTERDVSTFMTERDAKTMGFRRCSDARISAVTDHHAARFMCNPLRCVRRSGAFARCVSTACRRCQHQHHCVVMMSVMGAWYLRNCPASPVCTNLTSRPTLCPAGCPPVYDDIWMP